MNTLLETKTCQVCENPFSLRKDEGIRDWSKRKYCSLSCYRKVPRPEEVKKRISETCKKNCPGWTVGKPRPIELRIKQSKVMKEIVRGGNHPFWKGGVSEDNRTERNNIQSTVEYKIWRTAVFEKDNYCCVKCGARNGNGKRIVLNAHHIKPFAFFPELRFAIDNGVTLCRKCHYTEHSKHK